MSKPGALDGQPLLAIVAESLRSVSARPGRDRSDQDILTAHLAFAAAGHQQVALEGPCTG
jgi:hypothetical protein